MKGPGSGLKERYRKRIKIERFFKGSFISDSRRNTGAEEGGIM
jgi:hypothetical protein